MTFLTSTVDITTVPYTNIDIQRCTDEQSVETDHKDLQCLFQHIPSDNYVTLGRARKQTPSISPTSEDSLTEAGSDYNTYFTYKYCAHPSHIAHDETHITNR
ncbi:hypothetical protein [Halodesulfovibrio aestuarii]|uniref:hypothetical protein n=1 Tax=Halodesulfovibrio aestuarii TaxID=126333 RepID=UPI000483DDC6